MSETIHTTGESHGLPDDARIRRAAELVAQPGSSGFEGEIGGSMAEFSAEYMGYIEEYLDADLHLVADRVLDLLRSMGELHQGFAVSQLDHCLQTATRAERDGASDDMVVAALCHDIGKTFSNMNHPAVAAEMLRPWVSDEAYWVIRYHQDFQGRHYYGRIGMDPELRRRHLGHEHYAIAERFADDWDQTAFDANYAAEPLEHFEPLVRAVFTRAVRVAAEAMADSTAAEPTSSRVLLVVGGDVVTMDRDRTVLVGGTVAIDGDRIIAVGSTSDLRAAHPAAEVFDATDCVVTPGMIDAHQHLTGDPLIRSCIPDLLPPGASIFEWSVPVHAAHQPDDDEASAVLSAVEALCAGVTTVVEAGTVAHADRVAAGLHRLGQRATLGVWGWDIEEGPFAAPADEVLGRQAAVLDAFPAGGLVEGWVTLVGHDLASDALLAGAADLARARQTGMTMHLSPTSSDPERYLERTGKRPVAHLDDLGVLGRHLLIGHGVWLDDTEVGLVLESSTAIAYCPWAYLRLGQGVCANGRHAEIVERGGRVALGCDATNAGDSIDILRTAAVAAGIARDTRVDPTRFGAHQAFELATIAGAEAIGMADRIGSLEAGKQADLVIHRTDTPGWTPRGDVGLQLVWGTDGRSVRDVFVAGRHVVADGRPASVDHDELAAMATHRQARLLERAGIEVPHPWPHVEAH